MRIFANLFLILFLADGLVSFADELLILLAETTALAGIRSVLSWAVILIAVPFYICLGIDKRLPKIIFLPQLAFIFWSVFQLWPLPVMIEGASYMLPAALGQVLLGVIPLYYLRVKSGKSLLLPPRIFTGPCFSAKHTVLFFIANVIILPVVIVYSALSFASLELDKQSGGFARLRPDGLRMTEKIYRLDSKEIRLTSMIHIADKAYFEDVINSISTERTIVLAEGVTDKGNRLTHRFSYGKLAQNLGLTSQEKMIFNGRLIGREDIQAAAPLEAGGTYDVLIADIDISQFDPKTIEFLNIIGREVLGGNSYAQGLRTYLAWIKENQAKITSQTIMEDILHKRNREVIEHIGRVVSSYDTIIIPWGALHMPEIEAAVLDKGFELSETRQRTSIDFKRILFPGGSDIDNTEMPERKTPGTTR